VRSGTNDLNFATLQSSDIQDVRELLMTFFYGVLPIRERLIGDTRENRRPVPIRQEEEMILNVMFQRSPDVRERGHVQVVVNL
jgi:hypothetical protein